MAKENHIRGLAFTKRLNTTSGSPGADLTATGVELCEII